MNDDDGCVVDNCSSLIICTTVKSTVQTRVWLSLGITLWCCADDVLDRPSTHGWWIGRRWDQFCLKTGVCSLEEAVLNYSYG